MPDREKAIKGLKEIAEYMEARADVAGVGKVRELFDSWYRAAADALALLREQEPVTPIIEHGFSYCGVCGRSLDSDFADEEGFPFCPNCGRKVKRDADD